MRSPRLRSFGAALTLVAIAAFAVRLTYMLWDKGGECRIVLPDTGEVITSPTECIGSDAGRPNDAVYYNAAANHLARGGGFTDPFHPDQPAADHPPLTIIVLAPVSWLGDHVIPEAILSDLTNAFLHRLTMVILGTVVVAGIGLVARRVAGERTGMFAACIAAIYPGLWISDALVFAETLTNLAVVVAIGCALSAREQLSPARMARLGVAVGVCALGRAELLLFAPLLAFVVVPLRRPRIASQITSWRAPRDLIRPLAVLAAGVVAVLGPWIAYNNARFEERTLISTNDGLALAASNCEPVYYGSGIGLTSYDAAPVSASPEERADSRYCVERPQPPGDQSEVSRAYRSRALRVIRGRLEWQPVVIAARVGRVWNVFRPFDMVWYNEGEDRSPWATRAAIFAFFPVAGAAITGGRQLRRIGRTPALLVLLVPMVTVTIAAGLTYGQSRYRAAAEPSLVVLAAVAVAHLGNVPRPRGLGTDPSGPSDPTNPGKATGGPARSHEAARPVVVAAIAPAPTRNGSSAGPAGTMPDPAPDAR
jgi:hypothetical protein